jgi:sugar phosphate isomerase/epimerase
MMRPDQIAINAISTAEAPLDALLPAYAQAGFKNVELQLARTKAWLAGTGQSIDDLQALFARHGLRCVGGFEQIVAVFADEPARKANRALHLENARLIEALGGGVIVVGTDGPTGRGSVGDLKAVGAAMRELVEQFPPTVSLAVEFNWSPLVRSLRSAAIVAQAAGHPRVGILFDPAHFHCTCSKLEDLKPEVIRHILHVHVDDMRDKPGDLSNCNEDRVLPGAGVLDLPAILGRIDESGYDGFYSIELFNRDIWALPPAEAAGQCYQAMRALRERMEHRSSMQRQSLWQPAPVISQSAFDAAGPTGRRRT